MGDVNQLYYERSVRNSAGCVCMNITGLFTMEKIVLGDLVLILKWSLGVSTTLLMGLRMMVGQL